MKIIFIGTPKFTSIILEGLIKNKYRPVLVITAPDKPVGRKQILTPSEVKLVAQKHNIEIVQPQKIENCKLKIENLKPDLIITAAYGQILPKEILDIPKYGSLNIHPSLLPKYRGPSPIQTAILNGDKKTGITIYLMDEKIDNGPILMQEELEIKNLNYEELNQKLAELGTELLLKTIPKWIDNKIKPKPQDESKTSYTKIIRKKDGRIDWKKSAHQIERQIRAFEPWPGSFTFWNNLRLKILRTEICARPGLAQILGQSARGRASGKTSGKTFLSSKNELCVRCGKDSLIVKELQLEGKKPMSSEEFLKGHSEFVGAILK